VRNTPRTRSETVLLPTPARLAVLRSAAWQAAERSLGTVARRLLGEVPLPLLRAWIVQGWLNLSAPVATAEIADRISLRELCDVGPSDDAPHRGDLDRLDVALGVDSEALRLRGELTALLAGADGRPVLSVVSPVYGAEAIVEELVRRVSDAAATITDRYEVVLVEDASPDGCWQRILAACERDDRVKGIRLSRNFGQHRAITAGLEHARGQWVAVMDCDLQDDPAFLVSLYCRAREGFDIVLAARPRRRHEWWRNLGAGLFHQALRLLGGSGWPVDAQIGTYSLLSRKAVEAFCRVGDADRHYHHVLRWLGFRVAFVPVEHRPRYAGRSAYTVPKLVRHFVAGITSRTDCLLHLALGASALFIMGSLLATVYLVTTYFLHGFKEGWTSTAVLILFGTGSVLFCVGVIGLYVGKIFEQVRPRPLYLIDESRNV
jgi:glycosyltransferase involved in cell wall biosynthesis